MTAPVGNGQTKMDLANIASAQVLDMLSPMDEMGVIAVDSSAHVIAKCRPISESPNLRSDILSIQSMGGGIFCYTALEASVRLLMDAVAGTKHIILFADAADAEEPGRYKELLKECAAANITCSVIGLGKDTDVDADFLKDIARRGNGRVFFTESATDLPRLFAQDTFMVARSSFIDEPVSVKSTPAMIGITQKPFEGSPTIGGYNLCYLRNGAAMAMVSQDEYAAPIVASWQAGLGRVLCYTGQADGKYTGAIANWSEVGEFFSSQARWMAGEKDPLGQDMMVTQRVDNGVCRIKLHLDPKRRFDPFAKTPEMTFLKGLAGRKPVAVKKQLDWENADTLSCSLNLTGSETVIATLDTGDTGKVSLSPVCLPYSPEFTPTTVEGAQTLADLAGATGGIERISIPEIWDDLPEQKQFINLSHFLALAAMALLLIEVFERRTGILSAIRLSMPRVPKRQTADQTAITDDPPEGTQKAKHPKRKSAPEQTKSTRTAKDPPPKTKTKTKPHAQPEKKSGLLDAMNKTQEQIKKRRR